MASFIYSLAFFLALMDNRCQKDSCSALGGFSVSCVIRNIPVSVDLLKVIQTKYGFDYGALRTGICGCAVIWSVFYCSEKYLSDSWQMSNDHAKLGFQGEKKTWKEDTIHLCIMVYEWILQEHVKVITDHKITRKSGLVSFLYRTCSVFFKDCDIVLKINFNNLPIIVLHQDIIKHIMHILLY